MGNPDEEAGMVTWVILGLNLRIVSSSITEECERCSLHRQVGNLQPKACSLCGRILRKVTVIPIRATYVDGRCETEIKDFSGLLRLHCLKLSSISGAEPNISISLVHAII